MDVKFREDGYLPDQEYKTSIDSFLCFFVFQGLFDTSISRRELFCHFLSFIKILNDRDLIEGLSYLIVDGSYCANKLNPNDIDLFIYYDANSLVRNDLEHYIDLNKHKLRRNGIHIITFVDFSNQNPKAIDLNKKRLDELSRNRFESYYSISKDGIKKGYTRLDKKSLIIKEGEKDVSTIA